MILMDKRQLRSLIAAAAVFILAYLTIRVATGVSTPFVVVEGRSMIPTLYNGDIVIVYKPPPQDISVGDIIVYKSLEGRLVIHRVIEVKTCGDSYCYITKGDNNLLPDNEMVPRLQEEQGVPYSRVLGVVASVRLNGKAAPIRIPYLGLITTAFR